MQGQSLKRGLCEDWGREMQGQSSKRGFCKDWGRKLQGQSLKRGLCEDWEVCGWRYIVLTRENHAKSLCRCGAIWLQDSRHLTEVTTIYGETVQAPLVYVEMLQFWRRYEPRP